MIARVTQTYSTTVTAVAATSSDPEFDVENNANRNQLDDCGGDVEQQEIEHLIDALGSALDNLGHLARAPREVEAQGQAVQPGEHVFGQIDASPS